MKARQQLRRFFYFKRGYSQYLTYVLGFVSLVETTVLSVSLLFKIDVWVAIAGTLIVGIPVAYATALIGRWDIKGGAKPIESVLNYANDPVFRENQRALYVLLKDKDPEAAERFRQKMKGWEIEVE